MIRPICVKQTSFTGTVKTITTTLEPPSEDKEDADRLRRLLSLQPDDVISAHEYCPEGGPVGYQLSTEHARIRTISNQIIEIEEGLSGSTPTNTKDSIWSVGRSLLESTSPKQALWEKAYEHLTSLYKAKVPWWKRWF